MNMIDKVGGVIIKDKRILVVRKKTKENFQEYIIPGGKRECKESDLDTLQRELLEELNVSVLEAEYLGKYRDIAVFENIPIMVTTYITTIKGNISVQNEIKEYEWIDRNFEEKGIKVGSIIKKYIIPELINRGLM